MGVRDIQDDLQIGWKIVILFLLASLIIFISMFIFSPLSLIPGVEQENLFLNNTTSTDSSITISSNNPDGFYMQPPYFVELNKEQCKPITCKCAEWGCLAYCYVCEEKTK